MSFGNVVNNSLLNTVPCTSALPTEQENLAALKIQSIVRGHFARVKVEKVRQCTLDYDLFLKAKLYIDHPDELKQLKRANNGKTPVYLPYDLDVVLKHSKTRTKERFRRMSQAQELCQSNGYQCLIVPKGRAYKEFVVESRLPLEHFHRKSQMGLYLENLDTFTLAIEEFTGFLCQGKLEDVAGESNDVFGKISKTPLGRYDNIPLYLENGVGRIGLVDLESFSPKPENEIKSGCSWACENAICFFPHHMEQIIQVAKKFDPDIEIRRSHLEEVRAVVLQTFSAIYKNHAHFLHLKGIHHKIPDTFSSIEKERIEIMQTNFRAELDYIYMDENSFAAYFSKDFVDNFVGDLPKMVDAAKEFVRGLLHDSIEDAGGVSAIKSNPQLISVRTVLFNSKENVHCLNFFQIMSTIIQLPVECEYRRNSLNRQILEFILKGFEEQNVISYYNPQFGPATQCLFI